MIMTMLLNQDEMNNEIPLNSTSEDYPALTLGNMYYVATNGNDNNSGTINSPWLTWQYAFNQLQPGDILYIRGGTYYPAVVSGGGYYCGVYVNNKDGTVDAQYRVEAFESEVPILDCSNITNNNYTHVGVYLNSSNYWYLKGLTVAYVPQYQAASRYGIGFQIAGGNHCTLELCVAHHNEGPGFVTRTTANETHFINCDSYYNYDPYNEGGDADGWDIGFMTEDSIVRLTGCRAWENGDDGFDMYLSEEQPSPYAGIYYLTNCWAWRNGYVPGTNTAGGNGCGFKYGDDSRTSTSPIRRFSYNCIASTNRKRGFSQESAQVAKLWYNCIAHNNGQYGFSFASYNISQDILYNNISYNNLGVIDALGSRTSVTNSWDAGAPTITDADFKSVIYTELATIRQSNGDLPLINYLHPASGSDIIGVGTDTPELYDGDGELWNDNRSIGAFEYVGTLNAPSVTTTSISSITTSSASGGGNVTSDGGATVTQRGICWATTQNPTLSNFFTTNGTGTGSFTSSLTALNSATTYYVRAYAINSAGTTYGNQVSFTTISNVVVPTVSNPTISNINTTSVTASSNVTSAGNGTVTARGFCWNTSFNPTISNSHTTNGSGPGSYSASITGLNPNTLYYIRAYATNSAGTAYSSSSVQFTTLSLPVDVYYVDNDGHDDTGDGSYNNPWATLSHAASEVTTPGSTIHIRDGNYTISSQISISPGVSIEGTANLPTFNCTYNGVCLYLNSAEGVNGNQSISYCRFVGSYPSGTNNIGIEVVGRSNVIIHHCEFEDFFKTAISFYGKAGKVGGYPDIYPTGNKIHDCEITNCACLIYPGDQGYGNIRVGGQQDMEIYNNIIIQEDRGFNLNGFGIKFAAHGFNMGLKIYNNTIEVPPRYTDGYYNFAIELWNSRGGIEIYNNNFKGTVDIGCNDDEDYPDDDHIALNDAGGYGFALQFHHNTCGYTTLQVASESGIDLERNVTGETYIYNNYFHNLNYPIRSSMNDSGEIQEAVYIYNNIINGVGQAGTSGGRAIMIPYSSYNSHFENWNIWNNVIYAGTSGNPTQGIRFRVTTGENISIKNNIIIGFDYAVYLQGGSITNLNTDRNMVYNNDNNTIYNDGCSLTGGTQTANIVDDPEFESAGSNFHLVQGSPAIGIGTPVNIPTGNYDYDGVEYGDPPSIGAFEYTGAAVIPVITTIYVSDISTFSVKSGGSITSDGGAAIIAKGVCWSTSQNPTISGSHTTDGTGTGSFVSNVYNLEPSTHYYIRAYATNTVGPGYGNQLDFNTLKIAGTSLLSGLMGYWKLDETTGAVLDAQGIINGTNYGATRGSSGKIGTSYTFNAAENDYVDFGKVCKPTTGITLTAWIYPGIQTNIYAGIIANLTRYGAGDQNGYTMFIDSSRLLCELFNRTDYAEVYSNIIITPNTWHFVALTWDGNIMSVYVDSNFPDASQARTTLIGYGVDSSLRFGSHSSTFDYTGRLDEVGIWNRSLTSDELYTIYNKGNGLSYPFGEQVLTSLPTVITSLVTDISSYRATCGGNVIHDGSLAVTAKGMCWSISPTPTIANYTTNNGTGEGAFVSSLTGLLASTTYNARAYATNSLGTNYGETRTFTTLATPTTPTSKIVDHNCTVLANIPLEYIQAAKTNLLIAYQHTSHGSQLITGMTELANSLIGGSTYAWTDSISHVSGYLSIDDYFSSGDLGSPDWTTWATLTRSYLDSHPNCNVMIWSWCGEVSYATEQNINTYLSLMNQLELDYPNVQFVYMTGHTDGTGVNGTLNIRNEQIRNYCITNNKWLYDFADIESYDPDENYYLDKAVNDNCDYNSNDDGTRDRNWATDWQDAHTEGVDWFMCYPAHTQALNGNLKAYAAWCLWAKLAGWGGTVITIPTVYTGAITNITSSSASGSGSIITDGGEDIIEKGLCWNISSNPTILNFKVIDGSGTGSFTSQLTGLNYSTTYYVRAYATNTKGTGYGDNYSFTTLPNVTPPITIFYVSTTGVDSAARNGDVGQEWASLSYACSRVSTSGSLIRVNSGNYVDNNLCSLSPGVSIIGYGPTRPNITTNYQGSPTYGYIRLYSSSLTNGNQSISNININGNLTTGYRGICVIRRSNVVIHDCEIKDFYTYGIIFDDETPITEYAVNNNVYDCSIFNCSRYISGSGGTGSVQIGGQQGFRFYNNIVHHNQRTTYTNGNGFKTVGYIKDLKVYNNTFYGDVSSDKFHTDSYDFCIELWGSTKSGIEIYNNTIYNNEIDIAGGNTTKGDYDYSVYVHDNSIGCISQLSIPKIGIIIEQDISTELSDVIIQNNHFKNLSNCIQFYPTLNSVYNNIKIQCNVFENIGRNSTGWNYSLGISYAVSSGPPFTTTNWYIENNTFVATTLAGVYESAAIRMWNVFGSTVNNIFIRNNIITNFEGYPLYSDVSGNLNNFYFTYNNMYNCGNPISLTVTPTNSDISTGNTTGNPLLVSNTDYHLSSTLSAAYRSGTNVNLIYDFDNVAWSIPYPSMGAYEYTGGGTTSIPIVTTSAITDVSLRTATGGGNVVSSGNLLLTQRGVCWSTSSNPTIANARTNDGTNLGPFISYLTNLNPSTHYYVRAYATNSLGTGYGSVVQFNTLVNTSIPFVNTSGISDVSTTTATGGGNVLQDGSTAVLSKGVCWNTSPNPTLANSYVASGTGIGVFTSYITNLNPSTNYYVRAYATNNVGTAYGQDVSFYTLPNIALPVVTTTTITDISTRTATSGGNVIHDGSISVVLRGICWSTSSTPTILDSSTVNGAGEGTFVSYLTNLNPSTNYYVRAYAINNIGISYGSSIQFSTLLNKSIPSVITTSVTDISIRSAVSGGNVILDGSAAITARGVCWSTLPAPTLSNFTTNNGTGVGIYISNLSNLNPSTYYYLRAYATNSEGTAYGNTVTFSTLVNSSIPTVITSPITNVTISTASGGGNVILDGSLAVTSRGICWSTTLNPTITNSSTNNGAGKGIFTSLLTSLNSSTNYYVRAYAVNSLGISYGENVSFTTPVEYTIPSVLTVGVSNISVNNAKGKGNVLSDGNLPVFSRGFCWNTTGNPTILDSSVYSGSGLGDFTTSIVGLEPSTHYFIRAYAINSLGISYGFDASFNTLRKGPKLIMSGDKYLTSGGKYLRSESLDS